MALSANSEMKVRSTEEDVDLADTAASSANPFVRLLFILVGAAVVLGGLWIGVGDNIMAALTGEDGDVPVVVGEASPIKVRPEQPGGMQVPNQGRLVYGVVDGSSAQPRMERLLPSPEKPVEVQDVLTRGVPETNRVVSETAPRGSADPAPLRDVPTAQDVAGLTAPPPPATEPVLIQETPAAPAGAPRSLTPPSSSASSVSAPPPPPAPTPKTVASAPVTAPPAPAPTAAPAPKPAPAPTQTASTPPPATAPATTDLSKSYRVQLAAARSEPAIVSEWGRLQSRHKDLLGELSLQVTKVDLGATKGIFYRLRAGPLTSDTAAKALCERLKQRKLGCLVVKPGA